MPKTKTAPRNRRPPSAHSKRPKAAAASPARGWSVSRDVVSQRLDDEVVLVQLKTDCVYALNQTAARFWELLASKKSLDAIERQLEQEFAVDKPTLERSVARLLSVLRAKKLVREKGKKL